MAKQFKVIVNTGKTQDAQTLLSEQGAGQRGRPLIIKAQPGAKYQLVEQGKSNERAPDNIKAKRVGKHLHLMFEADTVADVIIEDYYEVTGSNVQALSAGQSAQLTFTLSEGSTDLGDADLVVEGGTLGPLQQSATNPLVYTATFTATNTSTNTNTTARVSVSSHKFSDAAGNLNTDGQEANNTWTSAVLPVDSGNGGNKGANVTPSSVLTALCIDPIAADNVLLANESGVSAYTVTGHVTGAFAAGDLVLLELNGKTYSARVNADGTYSTQVAMADLKADADTRIKGTIVATGGDTATAAQDYVVEPGNVLTQTALSIDAVASWPWT
jgi:Bacterial Ig-like domain